MKRTALETYALTVCFFTVACFVISLGIGLYSAIQAATPEFTLDQWTYQRHQTNDAFWQGGSGAAPCPPYASVDNKSRPPEAELTKQRLESYSRAVKGEQRSAMQTLVKALIVLLIDVGVFLVHWRIARHARSAAS
jgi:hypothetical protein